MTNPFDGTILLNLDLHKLGDRRTVKEEVVEQDVDCDTDKSMIKVSKKILECPEYSEIKALIADMRAYLRRKSLPGAKFIRGGVYAIPLNMVEAVDKRLEDYKVKFAERVKAFLKAYDGAVQDAMKRLKVLQDVADYPDVKKVKASFWLRHEYITMGPPGQLKTISAAIWEREKAKAAAQMREAAADVQDAMRGLFKGMVEHMADSLGKTPDGKKKVFKTSSIDKLKEFMDDFASKNITGDAELAKLVGNARSLLNGVAPEALRKDESLREATGAKLAEIKDKMNKLLTDAPKRKIILDD